MTVSRLRALGAVSATALVGALFTPVALAAPVEPAPEGSQNVTLFTTNDFHGRLASTGHALACTLETERLEPTYGTSFFLSAGDNIGASEFESMILDEEPTIAYLNALGLDASAVGNHEFDEGIDTLQARIAGDGHVAPEFDYLGANVEGSGLESYSIEERDTDGDGDTDLTVAVVGAVTQETPSLVSPSGVEGLTFTDQVDAVEAVIANEPEVQDADVVVAAYHDGSSNSADLGTNPGGSDRFAAMSATAGADVVLNGHTHQVYAFDENGVPVSQTGSYGDALGAVTLNLDADDDVTVVDSQMIETGAGLVENEDGTVSCAGAPESTAFADASDVISDAVAQAEVLGAEVVGTQTDDITTAFDAERASYVDGAWAYTGEGQPTKGDDRLSDSALSNLIADSMVWNTRQENYSGSEAVIGVMNPGGVRADLLHAATGSEADGEITYKEAANVLPFANSLFTGEFTGAQIYQLLEQQWQPEDSSRPFLALGLSENLTYTYDETNDRGSRITAVFLEGEPIDADATYTLVSASFLLPDGGDNFTVLSEGADYADSGLTDLQAFTDFLAAHQDLSADFTAHGIETVLDSGTITIRNLDVTSLGAPQIAQAVIEVDGTEHRADYAENPETGDLEATFDHGAWDLPAGEHPVTLLDTDPATGTSVPLGILTIEGDGSDGAPGSSDGPGQGGGTGAPGNGKGQGADNANDKAKNENPGQGPKVGLASETSDDRIL